MARRVEWKTEEFVALCKKGGMVRLAQAAEAVAVEAKRILHGKVRPGGITRVPGRQRMVSGGKLVPASAAPVWMERTPGAMAETIRVTIPYEARKKLNVWIMAGNYKTWWALQMEYGRGGWKGGRKSFLRPALKNATRAMQVAMESGQGETSGR